MIHDEFIERIKNDFIKDNNYLLIRRCQSTTIIQQDYDRDSPIFCEIITENEDTRYIIRISSPQYSKSTVGTYLKIEMLQIIFRSAHHPNLSFAQQSTFKCIFNGTIASSENSNEIDMQKLVFILHNRKSFFN